MRKVWIADNSADRFERGADEAISPRVDREVLEPGRRPSHARATDGARSSATSIRPRTRFRTASRGNVAAAELTSLPLLHGMGEDFGDEVWEVVRVVFHADHPDSRAFGTSPRRRASAARGCGPVFGRCSRPRPQAAPGDFGREAPSPPLHETLDRLFGLSRRVEPVFREERPDVGLDDLAKPRSAFRRLPVALVGVT